MGSCQSRDNVQEGSEVKKTAQANAHVQEKASVSTAPSKPSAELAPPTNATPSLKAEAKVETSDQTGGIAPEHASVQTANTSASTPDDESIHSHVSTSSHTSGASSGSGWRSGNETGGEASVKKGKSLRHSSSAIGLDSMIESKREEGHLKTNVVHIEVPFGKPIEEVYSGVHNGPVLGSGISGIVRLATHKATGVKYAVKILDLGLIETEEGLQQLREEIFIMCQLDHPNIVRLEEVYESHNEIYLVQELCLGGELFDRLDEQPDYHYTEQQCARLVKQMLSAVKYIHRQGIVHRDLKLENFLFSTTSADSELKMIDFGLSKHFAQGEVQNEAVGTPYTVAPEVIRGRYDERCDVWAIGVITFLLLSGDPPFGGCGGPEPLLKVRQNILEGEFHFEPEEVWATVSQQARDFISSLLVTDPELRPNAAKAQKSRWLLEWANNEKKAKGAGQLNPNVVKALVNFKEYSDMRKLLCEVLSFTLLPDQIQDLRAEFEKMDTEGSGEITLSALKTVLMQNAGAGSLGALTEEEVEDIFNAMRVHKAETTIQWHEFIAAGLSQCKVDDRNLRLAFDRLDSDHKGYITFDDVLDLMGSDATEESLRSMYQDSLQQCKCEHSRITYEDFLLLMKGQTNESKGAAAAGVYCHSPVVSSRRPRVTPGEELRLTPAEVPFMPTLAPLGGTSISEGKLKVVREEAREAVAEPVASFGVSDLSDTKSPAQGVSPGALANGMVPVTMSGNSLGSTNDLNSGLPLHDTDATPDMLPATSNVELAMKRMALEPDISSGKPTTEKNGFVPSTPPRASPDKAFSSSPRLLLSAPISPLGRVSRLRSRSLDEREDDRGLDSDEINITTPADSRRCVNLPEHDSGNTEDEELLSDVINDESRTALVVNRELYRAHRRMRLAVLDASKRFEEQQMVRAQKSWRTQLGVSNVEDMGVGIAAGLVMRRGQLSRDAPSEMSVRQMMQENEKETQKQLETLSRRAGRGRRNRKKTMSDIGGMLGSPSSQPKKTLNRGTAENSFKVSAPVSVSLSDMPPMVEEKGSAESTAGNSIAKLPSSESDGMLSRHLENSPPPSPPTQLSAPALNLRADADTALRERS